MPKMLIEIDTDTQVVVPIAKLRKWSSNCLSNHGYRTSGGEIAAICDGAPVMVDCEHCAGFGDVAGEYPGIQCPACKGIGMVEFLLPKPEQPAPIQTGWQPIETAPTDVLHVRGLWVYDDSGQPLSFDCDTGRIDDDGFFVDEFGNPHGWLAGDYTHWHPLAIPPAPGVSDE